MKTLLEFICLCTIAIQLVFSHPDSSSVWGARPLVNSPDQSIEDLLKMDDITYAEYYEEISHGVAGHAPSANINTGAMNEQAPPSDLAEEEARDNDLEEFDESNENHSSEAQEFESTIREEATETTSTTTTMTTTEVLTTTTTTTMTTTEVKATTTTTIRSSSPSNTDPGPEDEEEAIAEFWSTETGVMAISITAALALTLIAAISLSLIRRRNETRHGRNKNNKSGADSTYRRPNTVAII